MKRKNLWCSFPGYVFGLVWAVLFGLIATTGFLYLGQVNSGDSKYFITVFVIYSFNVILTKVWYPIFFAKTTARMGLALFIAILISATAIVNLVIMGVDQSFLTLGLYAPYVLWSLYACYLNYQFWQMSDKTERPVVQGAKFERTVDRRKAKKRLIVV